MTVASRQARRIIIPAIIFIAFLGFGGFSRADDTLDDLRRLIDEKNTEIEKLEKDIEKYRDEVESKQEQGKSLKNEIGRLNSSINKIQSEIVLNERKIQKTELEIEEAGFGIRDKEIALRKLHGGLAGILQSLFEQEKESLITTFIKYRALSDFFRQLDQTALLKERLLKSLDTVKNLKKELEIKKANAEEKKAELEDLKKLLGSRKNTLAIERGDRNTLLKSTQNEEKKYQQLLKDQEKKRGLLEQEIREIELKIRITIDPSSLPPKGTGVLGWPLQDVSLASCWKNGGGGPARASHAGGAKNCVTQFFGYTDFAAIGGYSGKGHNGMDFRASVGTPVFSAEDGIVEGAGDTDLGCRGASYGKWILIRHDNNLSTLYAHLASIEVSRDGRVSRGERMGLSGSSGYATGPHLHFTVFASQAVEVTQIRSRVCGRLMTLPIAAINGYLNPLDYL